MKKHRLFICMLSLLLLAACAPSVDPVVEIAVPLVIPAPDPVVSPTKTPVPQPAPTPDKLSPGEGAYTFAWISDTQHYSETGAAAFPLMTAFLAANQSRLQLAYILHTGDLVQNYSVRAEWEFAQSAMEPLSGLPCGILAGNHDVHFSSAKYDRFTEYFEGFIRSVPCFGGASQSGRCHYDLIQAGSTPYVFVFVGYPPTEEAARYASSVFREYPDRVGVLCTHDYFKTNRTRSEYGELLFDEVVRPNENVYLVLCGHRYSVGVEKETLGSRTVYQLIANYQAAGSFGGYGYIRFLQINETKGTISAFSYSPLLNDYGYYDLPWSQQEKYPVDPADEVMELPIPWHDYSIN